MLLPDQGDDISLYKTEVVGGKIMMAAREDGRRECRYLGPGGCTIYAIRPFLCRLFDCRPYFLMKMQGKNRQQRREMVAKEPHLREIFTAAQQRLSE